MKSGDALIQDFVAGRYRAIETGLPVRCPIRAIVTAPSLAGREAELERASENVRDVSRVVEGLRKGRSRS